MTGELRLGDLADIESGYAFKSSDWVTQGNPVVKIKNVKDGYVSLEDCGFVSDEIASKASRFTARGGDVLVSLTGYVGQVGRVEKGDTALVNQRVGLVRPADESERSFVYHLLRNLRTEIEELATGTAQANVAPRDIMNLNIENLGQRARKKIGEVLDFFDFKIGVNTRISQTLEDLAQTIFKSWFVDFDPVKAKMAGEKPFGLDDATASLFPDSMEDSELGPIPKGWVVATIGEVVVKQRPGKLYEQKTSSRVGSIPVLDQGRSGVVGYHNDVPGYVATPESPVVVFANHTCSLRFISYPFSVIQNVFPILGNDLSVYWLYFALQGKQEFDSYKGHWPDLVIRPVVRPTQNLTEAFEQLISPLMKLTWNLEKENQSLVLLRDSLTPRLISGELQIPQEMLVTA